MCLRASGSIAGDRPGTPSERAQKPAVVQTYPVPILPFLCIIKSHHVSALHGKSARRGRWPGVKNRKKNARKLMAVPGLRATGFCHSLPLSRPRGVPGPGGLIGAELELCVRRRGGGNDTR